MRKQGSIEKRNSKNGFMFTLPWVIGVLIFFLMPMLQSIYFAFSDVKVTTSGFGSSFVGLSNFKYALYESPQYINNFLVSLSEFAYKIPIILILSFIIAVVLNGKFVGRTVFRSIYFIPVIIANSMVMQFLGGNQTIEEMGAVTQSAYLSGLVDFEKIFLQMGIPTETTNFIFSYVDQIFDLVWQSGVQIILFISGLQSIPEQLYEVSKVEGASKWEEFWYITVPMLGNTIVLAVIFTVIEFCVSTDNKVVSQAYTMLLEQQIYGKSSAMLWIFFAVIAVIVGALFMLFNKLCLKKWQ